MHNLKSNYINITQENRLYNAQHPIIALTGGIATGKSTTVKLMAKRGIPIIDADQLVKEIYSQNESKDFIRTLAPGVIDNANKINFMKLRKEFFENSKIKSQIEVFIYKRIQNQFLLKYQQLDFSNFNFLVYDIPLLFEKNLQEKFDVTVLVYCQQATQIQRLMDRDNISIDLAQKIVKQQLNIEVKKKMAQHVIPNISDKATLDGHIEAFLSKIIQ